MGYKPDGYTDLAPYLIVADMAQALDFVEAAFGAERLRSHARPDGTPAHAEVRIGDTVVMMGQMDGATSGAHVHLYVPDVRKTYDAALAAGGRSVQPLRQGRRRPARWRHRSHRDHMVALYPALSAGEHETDKG